MKFIQIVQTAQGNLFALTNEGEIYAGFFVGGDQFVKPKFQWRKCPAPPEKCFEFETAPEKTLRELALMKKNAESKA